MEFGVGSVLLISISIAILICSGSDAEHFSKLQMAREFYNSITDCLIGNGMILNAFHITFYLKYEVLKNKLIETVCFQPLECIGQGLF